MSVPKLLRALRAAFLRKATQHARDRLLGVGPRSFTATIQYRPEGKSVDVRHGQQAGLAPRAGANMAHKLGDFEHSQRQPSHHRGPAEQDPRQRAEGKGQNPVNL